MDDLSHVTGRVFRRLVKPNGSGDGEEAAHVPESARETPDLFDDAPSWKRVTEFPQRGGDDRLPPPQMQPAAE